MGLSSVLGTWLGRSKGYWKSPIAPSGPKFGKTYWSPWWALCTPRAWISSGSFKAWKANETLWPRQAWLPRWSSIRDTAVTGTKSQVPWRRKKTTFNKADHVSKKKDDTTEVICDLNDSMEGIRRSTENRLTWTTFTNQVYAPSKYLCNSDLDFISLGRDNPVISEPS